METEFYPKSYTGGAARFFFFMKKKSLARKRRLERNRVST